ncbi:MAG: aryl-sulfate sulfotransferase [Lachnospiraceae bacterium]|nr:aryl-sulfate sulfotransferase [Lachnospiraceae bacterium]
MKKKLIIVLITSLLMFAAMGGLLWKASQTSKMLEKEEREKVLEEKDLLENQTGKAIDSVKNVDIVPLYISGKNKNVITVKYNSVKDIYDPEKSAAAEENITNIKKKSSFSTANPLWAYNPYGTNRSSMYVYFKTEGKCYCKYTVSVKDSKFPDFTRTLINGGAGNISKEHEYQIIGLVPGKTNYITLKLYNKNDELSQSLTYSITMPKSSCNAKTMIKSSTGYSRKEIQNGLFTIFGEGRSVKKTSTKIVTKKVVVKGKKRIKRVKKTVTKKVKKYAILLYDNSGVLRGEIPLDGYCGRNVENIYDNIVYACANNKITEVNSLGQVVKTFRINGYKQSGEFAYDGFGNIYVIATEVGRKSVPNSKVIKIELESKKTSVALDMNGLLKSVYKSAVKKSGKSNPDWICLNSIQVAGTNKLLLSSQKLSSIFKVSSVNSLLPKIDYIISDSKIWKNNKKLKRKVLKKAAMESADATPTPEPTETFKSILDTKKSKPDIFPSQYGQNAIKRTSSSSLAEGQYYLSMLNNNSGSYSKGGGKSYYYSYIVDENARTYMLSSKKAFNKTSKNGNVVKKDGIYLYCDSGKRCFSESDDDGKLIKKFNYDTGIYRVYKKDWKNFWFY